MWLARGRVRSGVVGIVLTCAAACTSPPRGEGEPVRCDAEAIGLQLDALRRDATLEQIDAAARVVAAGDPGPRIEDWLRSSAGSLDGSRLGGARAVMRSSLFAGPRRASVELLSTLARSGTQDLADDALLAIALWYPDAVSGMETVEHGRPSSWARVLAALAANDLPAAGELIVAASAAPPTALESDARCPPLWSFVGRALERNRLRATAHDRIRVDSNDTELPTSYSDELLRRAGTSDSGWSTTRGDIDIDPRLVADAVRASRRQPVEFAAAVRRIIDAYRQKRLVTTDKGGALWALVCCVRTVDCLRWVDPRPELADDVWALVAAKADPGDADVRDAALRCLPWVATESTAGHFGRALARELCVDGGVDAAAAAAVLELAWLHPRPGLADEMAPLVASPENARVAESILTAVRVLCARAGR